MWLIEVGRVLSENGRKTSNPTKVVIRSARSSKESTTLEVAERRWLRI